MKIIKKKVIIILLLILVCFNNIKTMDYGNQNKNPNLQSNDQISVYVKKSGRFTVKTIYNIQFRSIRLEEKQLKIFKNFHCTRC